MKKNYLQPKLAILGEAKNVIQGDCGWGSENKYLDKTGYYRKSWKQVVTHTTMTLTFYIDERKCEYTTTCANKNEC